MLKRFALLLATATVFAASIPLQDSPTPTCGPCDSRIGSVAVPQPADSPTPTCGPCDSRIGSVAVPQTLADSPTPTCGPCDS